MQYCRKTQVAVDVEKFTHTFTEAEPRFGRVEVEFELKLLNDVSYGLS